MNVLVVEDDKGLGCIWVDHITRHGAKAQLVHTQDAAVEVLQDQKIDILILNLNLSCGSAMAVADYASYRQPNMKVIFVTNSSFFSDGSIFSYMANACAMIPHATPPEDLAAMVDYHGR